jgi:hypothetical protein
VDLKRPAGMSEAQQRAELDLLQWQNEQHRAGRSNTGDLEARIAAYELAFRMQATAPELLDLSGRELRRPRSCTGWTTGDFGAVRAASVCWRGGWWSGACGL